MGGTLLSTVFWAWFALTVLLALGEAVTGGLFVLPWAIGAAVATALEALHVTSGWQWIAFIGVSMVLFVVVQRSIARRR